MKRNEIVLTKELFGSTVTLKTGKLAPQADMSVLVTMGETTVLATLVTKKNTEDPGFLPLTINYEEKTYAAGLIKSNRWIKREGRPSDDNITASRLVDHCARYLFPKDLRDEIQVALTVMSVDEKNSPEITAMIAASALLTASNIPFNGPFATLQLGYINNNFVINPSHEDLHNSDLNLIISYVGDKKVQAMEASINLLSDEKIFEAIEFGSVKSEELLSFINEFSGLVGNKKREYVSFKPSEQIYEEVKKDFGAKLTSLLDKKPNKLDFFKEFELIQNECLEFFKEKYKDEDKSTEVKNALDKIQTNYIRDLVLEKQERIDGRGFDDVRTINTEVNVLPRVHGSAFFERELTQSISVVTLASPSFSQISETLYGETESFYFHHYVAPGFSTGEVSRGGGFPGRREIGHGMLAQKALIPVLPKFEEFPYTIRVVSEVLSQNGSSSMASTCGSSLSLMDAGVPIKELVGGVSVGLFTNEDYSKTAILTDIQGFEDFAGFMDFKMTGTKTAVTAIQMDIKLAGIPVNLFKTIIEKSKQGRLFVIGKMEETIKVPNTDVKPSAPKNVVFRIKPTEMGMVIGSGGKTIREIEGKFDVKIDLVEHEEYGEVIVAGKSRDSVSAARDYIKNLLKKPEVGEVYNGVVTKLFSFGCLVEFLPGKEGLLHISEMGEGFIENVEDVVSEGKEVRVKIKEIGNDGKYSLTLKFKE